jgi:hypothetical protein
MTKKVDNNGAPLTSEQRAAEAKRIAPLWITTRARDGTFVAWFLAVVAFGAAFWLANGSARRDELAKTRMETAVRDGCKRDHFVDGTWIYACPWGLRTDQELRTHGR